MDNLSSLAEELGRTIRTRRIAANLTQAELAAELSVSERSIQDWEAGKAFPRAKQRKRIAAYFFSTEEAA